MQSLELSLLSAKSILISSSSSSLALQIQISIELKIDFEVILRKIACQVI
jgi:hypothetical protein